MSNFARRARLSVESLETRETPSSVRVTFSEAIYSGQLNTTEPATVRVAALDRGIAEAKPLMAVLVIDLDTPARETRPRFFAIVDRTQAGGTDGIWIDMAVPVMVAGDGRAPSGDMVLKGSTITENALVDAGGSTGLLFYPLPSPIRLLDTRPG